MHAKIVQDGGPLLQRNEATSLSSVCSVTIKTGTKNIDWIKINYGTCTRHPLHLILQGCG
jgi:hypothetical protein